MFVGAQRRVASGSRSAEPLRPPTPPSGRTASSSGTRPNHGDSRRGVALATGLASLALLAAGCGGSKAPSVASLGTTAQTKTTASASAPLSPRQETAVDNAYAACINAHGGQARAIPGGGVGLILTPATRGRLPAAQEACRKLLPKGGLPAQTPAQNAQFRARALKLAQCMRANGVPKFPDPSANGNLLLTPSSGIDPQSPQFQAAQKACARYFPGGAPP
jgi:hypothetical protein